MEYFFDISCMCAMSRTATDYHKVMNFESEMVAKYNSFSVNISCS